MVSRSSGLARSSMTLRLPRLNSGKNAVPMPPSERVLSPAGGSTLITSAPSWARIMPQVGPITMWVISMTLTPSSGSPASAMHFSRAHAAAHYALTDLLKNTIWVSAHPRLHNANARKPDRVRRVKAPPHGSCRSTRTCLPVTTFFEWGDHHAGRRRQGAIANPVAADALDFVAIDRLCAGPDHGARDRPAAPATLVWR